MIGDRLFASGLINTQGNSSRASRVLRFDRFLETNFKFSSAILLPQRGIELGQEAMAIAKGGIYFLPENLGTSNRLFRLPLAEVMSFRAAPP